MRISIVQHSTDCANAVVRDLVDHQSDERDAGWALWSLLLGGARTVTALARNVRST